MIRGILQENYNIKTNKMKLNLNINSPPNNIPPNHKKKINLNLILSKHNLNLIDTNYQNYKY